MRIRSYYANSVEDGMAMARADLGPDAMLVNSRRTSPETRHLGDYEVVIVTDLAAAANPFRVRALEEIAKHYEHREKNYAMALEMTRSALEREDSPDLRKREQRLLARVRRHQA